METTRSFPWLRTAVTSLPAADKPICHEVIKRHVLCLQELAPGFVPPKPEAAHPPRRQTMAIVPCRAAMGTHFEPFVSPECHQNTPRGTQAMAALSTAAQMCPHSPGVSLASPHGDTARGLCVLPPARCKAQGTQPAQFSHDKQSQSPRLDGSWVIPLSQSCCLLSSAWRGAGCTQA